MFAKGISISQMRRKNKKKKKNPNQKGRGVACLERENKRSLTVTPTEKKEKLNNTSFPIKEGIWIFCQAHLFFNISLFFFFGYDFYYNLILTANIK